MNPSLPPTARSPLHAWHAARGARFRDSDGWQVPASYTTADAEVEAARSGVGLADISAYAKRSLFGPRLPTAFGAHRPGDVGVIDRNGRAFACRLSAEHLLLIALSTGARFADVPGGASPLRLDVTTAHAGFCLLGPEQNAVRAQLTMLDALPEGRCAETGLAGVPALLVRPPGFALPALQVFVSWDVAEYVWERLLEVGRRHRLTPVGWDALDRLAPTGS